MIIIIIVIINNDDDNYNDNNDVNMIKQLLFTFVTQEIEKPPIHIGEMAFEDTSTSNTFTLDLSCCVRMHKGLGSIHTIMTN